MLEIILEVKMVGAKLAKSESLMSSGVRQLCLVYRCWAPRKQMADAAGSFWIQALGLATLGI